MTISTDTINLPETFDPTSYSEIPYSRHSLFEDSNPELETMARDAIRSALEVKLGKPVVSRDVINQRFGLKRLGYTSDHILSGRVLVR